MPNLADKCIASDLPKAVILETCDFPVVPGDVDGYKVLELPWRLRRIFDEDGMSVVRVNSLEVASSIPDYKGKSSGDYSLLPHQDHLDPAGDRRRFLMLSKRTDGARGSSTLIMTPAVAATLVPLAEGWIKDDTRRAFIGTERSYDPRFETHITEGEYNSCFTEEGGYERIIAALVGENPNAQQELAVRLGILGYLIRGSCADTVMREIVQKCPGKFYEERWERGGIVIIDNARVFHARLGGNNPPLQRNYCI